MDYNITKKKTKSEAVGSNPIGSNPIGGGTGAAASGSGLGTVTRAAAVGANGFSPNGKNVMADINGRNVMLSGEGTYIGTPRVTKQNFENAQGFSPNGGTVTANVNGRNVKLSGEGTYLAAPYETAVKKLMSEQSASPAGVRRNVPYDAGSNGYGIRAELVNAGLSDGDIGWDGQWVTYKGQKLLMPTANVNGTTYAGRSDILQAINRAYEGNGERLVQLNQYANPYGMEGLISYNPSTRAVTVNGQSVPYAYIDDSGNAWVTEDAAKNAFEAAAKKQSIKDPQNFLDAYDKVTGAAQDKADAAASRMKSWSMSAGDMEKDAAYQAYKQMYLREAARAYADGLGQAAAMNGGNLSSAALAAAGQGQQYYLSQLNDRVPELYQMAYERYLNGEQANIDNQRQIMQNAQNKYAMQYEANRNRLADQNAVKADAYQRLLNELDLRDRRQAYGQTEFENAIKRGQARGSYTPEEGAYLGIAEGTSPYDAEARYNTYLWDNSGKRQKEEETRIATDSEKEIQQQAHENNMEAAGINNQYSLNQTAQEYALKRLLQQDQNRYSLNQTAQEYALKDALQKAQDERDAQYAENASAREFAIKLLLQDPYSYASLPDEDIDGLADSFVQNGAITEENKPYFIDTMRKYKGMAGN